jgi:hypothetical protein
MPTDNPGEWPLEIVVYSNDGFIAFGHSLGYSYDAINDTRFQSINSLSLPPESPFNTDKERVCRLYVPMWRWEVEKDEWLGKYKVTFV